MEEFDPLGIVLPPGGDPARPLDRQIVDDHAPFGCGLADQAAQESEKIGALRAPS
jgi:hypothetical protein